MMAKKARATFQKREKERARQQKQHDKAQRRVAAKAQSASSAPRLDGNELASIKSWHGMPCGRCFTQRGPGRRWTTAPTARRPSGGVSSASAVHEERNAYR